MYGNFIVFLELFVLRFTVTPSWPSRLLNTEESGNGVTAVAHKCQGSLSLWNKRASRQNKINIEITIKSSNLGLYLFIEQDARSGWWIK